MEAIIGCLLKLAIISCGISVMASGFRSKKGMDPWLILRPIGRFTWRSTRRTVPKLAKALCNGANSMWRHARHPRTPVPAKVCLYPLSVLVGICGIAVSIPAYILGEIKK